MVGPQRNDRVIMDLAVLHERTGPMVNITPHIADANVGSIDRMMVADEGSAAH